MPTVVRWYLKTALIMFILSLLVGVFQGLNGITSIVPPGLTPVYFHLLMVGWITQFIFGIAIWMLPKFSMEKPRRSDELSWVIYFLLNTGLLVRALSEPLNTLHPGAGWGWVLVTSAFLQWLAGVFFVVNSWNRVRGK